MEAIERQMVTSGQFHARSTTLCQYSIGNSVMVKNKSII